MEPEPQRSQRETCAITFVLGALSVVCGESVQKEELCSRVERAASADRNAGAKRKPSARGLSLARKGQLFPFLCSLSFSPCQDTLFALRNFTSAPVQVPLVSALGLVPSSCSRPSPSQETLPTGLTLATSSFLSPPFTLPEQSLGALYLPPLTKNPSSASSRSRLDTPHFPQRHGEYNRRQSPMQAFFYRRKSAPQPLPGVAGVTPLLATIYIVRERKTSFFCPPSQWVSPRSPGAGQP